MSTKIAPIALGALLATGVLSTASAEEQGLTPAAIAQMDLVNQLIAYGDARKDPVLLIAAAKLQKSISPTGAAESTESHAPADVLARAKTYAAGDKTLEGLAEDVAAASSKGYHYNYSGTSISSYSYTPEY
jgi:hypothetical protein